MPVIRELDRPVKQVLIEAHIVEAESTTGKALGIQWGGLSSSKTSSDKQISVGGNISPFGESLQDGSFYEPVDGNVVNLPAIASTGMNLGIMAQKMGSFVLYTQLMALQEEGVLNILSKPSITTQNHQKAVIKSGKEIPYQTVQDNEISIEWKEAVIKLEVTPHVVDDRLSAWKSSPIRMNWISAMILTATPPSSPRMPKHRSCCWMARPRSSGG